MKRKMSRSESDEAQYWTEWFLSLKGNEYFCEVDEEFIVDKFNLTGLNSELPYFSQALDLITDSLQEDEFDVEVRADIEKSAQHLYGLIHARFILTNRGLQKMGEKFKRGVFGRCPRVLCGGQPVLPVGLSDLPRTKTVKIYCPKCEDVYHPRSSRHANLDGAYFGTTFTHILFQIYPHLAPPKAQEKYVPRIYGFKIHQSVQMYQRKAPQESSSNSAGNSQLPANEAMT